jgi:hypothetical protein
MELLRLGGTWGDYRERLKIIRRAADLISERKYELAAIMSIEAGKSRFESMGDVEESAEGVMKSKLACCTPTGVRERRPERGRESSRSVDGKNLGPPEKAAAARITCNSLCGNKATL